MARDATERVDSRARDDTPTSGGSFDRLSAAVLSESKGGGGAFGLPEEDLPPEDRDRLIDSIARRVVGRGLAAPAVFLLEMHKPLCFFGSQMLLLGSPILGPFVGFGRLARLSSLIENRANVDLLLGRIEELVAEAREGGAR